MNISKRDKTLVLFFIILGVIAYGGIEATNDSQLATWGECGCEVCSQEQADYDCEQKYDDPCMSCIGYESTADNRGYCAINQNKPGCEAQPTPTNGNGDGDGFLKKSFMGIPLWALFGLIALLGLAYMWRG